MEHFFVALRDVIADNWPAFVYILITTGFSIRFLYERRAEAQIVRDIGENLRREITSRLDRIEDSLRSRDLLK